MEQIWTDHGSTIVIAVVVVIAISVLAKLLSPKKKIFAEDMTLNVQCRKCKWQGTVTKYNQTCRKCNGSNLGKM